MTMTPLGPQNDVISLNNMPVITYSVTNLKKRHMYNSKHAHIRLTYVGKVHIVPCKCLHMTHIHMHEPKHREKHVFSYSPRTHFASGSQMNNLWLYNVFSQNIFNMKAGSFYCASPNEKMQLSRAFTKQNISTCWTCQLIQTVNNNAIFYTSTKADKFPQHNTWTEF